MGAMVPAGKTLLQVEGVTRVGSIAETSMPHGKDGELIISPVLGPESNIEESFKERLNFLSYSPLTRGRFFNQDMRTSLLTVRIDKGFCRKVAILIERC